MMYQYILIYKFFVAISNTYSIDDLTMKYSFIFLLFDAFQAFASSQKLFFFNFNAFLDRVTISYILYLYGKGYKDSKFGHERSLLGRESLPCHSPSFRFSTQH